MRTLCGAFQRRGVTRICWLGWRRRCECSASGAQALRPRSGPLGSNDPQLRYVTVDVTHASRECRVWNANSREGLCFGRRGTSRAMSNHISAFSRASVRCGIAHCPPTPLPTMHDKLSLGLSNPRCFGVRTLAVRRASFVPMDQLAIPPPATVGSNWHLT
jgi:hypothetical protein